MKIITMLQDIKFGKPQNVGNMIVIPLVSETECSDVSEDMLFNISSDSDYAHLTLRNTEDRPVIVPQGTAYINKQKAQDRTVLSTEVLGANEEKEVDVGCVQSSEGGNMQPGTDEFTFIPATIRTSALEKHAIGQDHNYDILWQDIEEYVKKIGIGGRAHIHDFYDSFKKELDEFVASFEPIEKQIGAIILINNVVVGIEIYPNYKSWLKVWRKLIRNSYGADAMGLISKKTAIGLKPILDIDKINSVDDLQEEVNKIIVKDIKFVKNIIDPLLEAEMSSIATNNVGDFLIEDISLGDLRGQLVKKDEQMIYLTAVKRSI